MGNIGKTSTMTEKKTTPYNIREKKEKSAAYRSLIRAELADELYDKILNLIVIEKRYRDKEFSAKDLAKELGTNTRYISAVINSRFNTNFSCLVNMTIEEIGLSVGFSNRQSFYASFFRIMNETPNSYRKRHNNK